MLGIVETKFAFQALTVESNVPVRGVIDEVQKSRNDSVKTISYVWSVLFT
jgi:hypothetical protein